MVNLEGICEKAISRIDNNEEIYVKEKLIDGCKNIIRNSMSEEEIRSSVIQVALELTTEQEPKWQYVASKLYVERLYDEVKINRNKKIEEIPYSNYYEFICEMTNKNLYGKYILENYTKEEIEELGAGALRNAVVDGDVDNGSVMAGQIAGLVSKEETCAEILEDIYFGAAKVIQKEAARWADVKF